MSERDRVSTGVAGLDEILTGGLLRERAYMVGGTAGAGKTILGVHFLTAGVEAGENSLFVAFEEDPEDIRRDASALGFDLDGVAFLDLTPEAEAFVSDRPYEVFEPGAVEGPEVTDRIAAAVADADPDRVFVDPLTHLQYFAPDEYQFRRDVAAFVRFLTDPGRTVLFSTQAGTESQHQTLQYLCDGSLFLGNAAKGRTVEVVKFRGSDYQSGVHTMRITETGIAVYPRLRPDAHGKRTRTGTIPSGVSGLDELLNGGIERSTVTVVSGPSGVGKTTTSAQFAAEAATRGERSVFYLFEEIQDTFLMRSESIGIPVEEMEREGMLTLTEVEPLAISSDEFARMVRTDVEEAGAEFVVLDGLSGYRLSIRGEDAELVRELHSLGRYLKREGVTTVFVDDVATVTGDFEPTSTQISYLADNILFLRYLEAAGELRKAVGVLKKRTSGFERTLREFEIRSDGIHVGEPLSGLRGVLTGTPDWTDDEPFDGSR